MLKVQEFLLYHSLKDLAEQHGVYARPSKDFSKYSLNYDQLEAKASDPIANQCRGLILRPCELVTSLEQPVGNTAVVARPMDRFLNAGDPAAAPIDWSTARIEEKLDGTMCLLYWDSVKNQWCVATRSVPEADVSFGGVVSPLKENTFYELFKHSVTQTVKKYYELPNVQDNDIFDTWCTKLDKSLTYIYELTSPLNRVVVKYDDYRVTLLAARETVTGRYVKCDLGYGPALQAVETWPLRNLKEIEAFLRDSDPAKIEGAVVVDAHYNRVKVKSAQWVLASRAKDMVNMSKRNALTCIIDGSSDDVIPLLSEELQNYMHRLASGLVEYCQQIDVAFSSYMLSAVDRKQFALFVQASGFWQTPFFNLYGGKWKTTLEWLRHLSANKKLTDSALDVLLENIAKIK